MIPSNPKELWSNMATYMVPTVAASVAIVPAFYDMVAKSALQKGIPIPNMTLQQKVRAGLAAAPTVGVIVGAQMIMQKRIELLLIDTFPDLFKDGSNKAKGSLMIASSALIGGLSSPFLAIYNGKTMTPRWSVIKSLSKFTPKQAGAITLQETGFVAGLAAADLVSVSMKQVFGDHKAIEYSAAAAAGAIGSLVGHPGNTALTRWQSGMNVDCFRQLALGSLRKARGTALFALTYKLGKEVLNSTI